MVQFECLKYRSHCVSSIFGLIPFSHFPLSGVIRNGLPSIRMRKLETFWEQTQLNRLQMVQIECQRVRKPNIKVFYCNITPRPNLTIALSPSLRESLRRFPSPLIQHSTISPLAHFPVLLRHRTSRTRITRCVQTCAEKRDCFAKHQPGVAGFGWLQPGRNFLST